MAKGAGHRRARRGGRVRLAAGAVLVNDELAAWPIRRCRAWWPRPGPGCRTWSCTGVGTAGHVLPRHPTPTVVSEVRDELSTRIDAVVAAGSTRAASSSTQGSDSNGRDPLAAADPPGRPRPARHEHRSRSGRRVPQTLPGPAVLARTRRRPSTSSSTRPPWPSRPWPPLRGRGACACWVPANADLPVRVAAAWRDASTSPA